MARSTSYNNCSVKAYYNSCYQIWFQTQGRESIAAKLVANLITEAGANRVLACDLHSGQSMGYFDIPVDHVYGQVKDLLYFVLFTIICTEVFQVLILTKMCQT